MLEPESVLEGRYVIEKTLGQGGMGTVYRGHLVSLPNRRVAIKELIRSDELEIDQAMKLFKGEAEILADLEHPNLVRVVDFFHVEGTPYLVMDFVDGVTLERHIEQLEGMLDLNQAMVWIDELCAVLEYLHTHDPPIIFRDLKPANIMLKSNGHIQLIDFGIARTDDPKTGTKTFVKGAGTDGYAPLEQYGGSTSTDHRSDVYSLGATIYVLLTKEVPPSAVSIVTGETELKNPRTLRPDLPPAVGQVILKMMATRKEDRFQSIAEVRAHLVRAVAPPEPAPPITGRLSTTTGQLSPRTAQLPSGSGDLLRPLSETVSYSASKTAAPVTRSGRRPRAACTVCGAVATTGTVVCAKCGGPVEMKRVALDGLDLAPASSGELPMPPPEAEVPPPVEEGPTPASTRQMRTVCPVCSAESDYRAAVCPRCGTSLGAKTGRRKKAAAPVEPRPAAEEPPLRPPTGGKTASAAPAPVSNPKVVYKTQAAASPDHEEEMTVRVELVLPEDKGFFKRLLKPMRKGDASKDGLTAQVEVIELTPHSIIFTSKGQYKLNTPLTLRVTLKQGDQAAESLQVTATLRKCDWADQGYEYTADLGEIPEQVRFLLESVSRDNRIAPRFQRTFAVMSRDLPQYKALAADISETGIKIVAYGRVQTGRELDLQLDLDDAMESALHCRVKVVWCKPYTDQRFLIGAVFTGMSDKDRNILNRVLTMADKPGR